MAAAVAGPRYVVTAYHGREKQAVGREDKGARSTAPPPPEEAAEAQSSVLEAALNRAPGPPSPSAQPGARR